MSRLKTAFFWVGLVSIASGAAIVGAELLLRITQPDDTFGAAREMVNFRGKQESFMPDPTTGVRPVFGREYTETGTLRNDYTLQKTAGVERVLFLGDSVTRRGRIIKALRAIYGDDRFEYWNAGVEAFGTVQEVAYYKQYARAVQPDHLVLTLHNNDFQATPVAFLDAQGQLVVYEPAAGHRVFNSFLFRHSMVYRLIVGLVLRGAPDEAAFATPVRNALAELKRLAERDGARLTVLVFPIVRDFQRWGPRERRNHRVAIEVLKDLNIRYFDLLDPLKAILATDANIQDRLQERPGDPWHPSDELGEVFASYLAAHELF